VEQKYTYPLWIKLYLSSVDKTTFIFCGENYTYMYILWRKLYLYSVEKTILILCGGKLYLSSAEQNKDESGRNVKLDSWSIAEFTGYVWFSCTELCLYALATAIELYELTRAKNQKTKTKISYKHKVRDQATV
jgi:hypothetical protein